jgi:hypothetical protein
MHGQRPDPLARPQPVADGLTVKQQGAHRAAFVRGCFALSEQRPVGGADGREVEDRTEVQRQTGSPRVIAAGGIDHHNVGPFN